MELAERDAVAMWWYNRLARPAFDLDSFGDPWMTEFQEVYAALGRDIHVLDLTNDLGIPVAVSISRRVDGPTEDIMMAFGAHFDVGIAVQRALAEMNQFLPAVIDIGPDGHTRYGFTGGDQVNWWKTARVADHPYLRPSGPAVPASAYARPATGDLLDDVAAVRAVVEERGMEMLVLDQTRPDIGLPVVKVIVPGMRHFWRRLAPGRLYDVPVQLGWLSEPTPEDQMNPITMFLLIGLRADAVVTWEDGVLTIVQRFGVHTARGLTPRLAALFGELPGTLADEDELAERLLEAGGTDQEVALFYLAIGRLRPAFVHTVEPLLRIVPVARDAVPRGSRPARRPRGASVAVRARPPGRGGTGRESPLARHKIVPSEKAAAAHRGAEPGRPGRGGARGAGSATWSPPGGPRRRRRGHRPRAAHLGVPQPLLPQPEPDGGGTTGRTGPPTASAASCRRNRRSSRSRRARSPSSTGPP